MTTDTVMLAAGLILYAAASVLSAVALVRPGDTREKPILLLMAAGMVPFLVLLIKQGMGTKGMPVYGAFEVIVWYCIAVAAAYIHIALKTSLKAVASLVVPYITVLLIIAASHVAAAKPAAPDIHHGWLNLHIVTAFAGYGLFTVASILAAAYLVQDHNLKHKKLGRTFESLPDLEILDTVMHRQVGFAFLVFSISIAAGVRLTHLTGSHAEWMTDPKTVASGVTWLLYAVLMHLRLVAKLHGRKIAMATVLGLAFILFTFIGIHLVSDSIHEFVLNK